MILSVTPAVLFPCINIVVAAVVVVVADNVVAVAGTEGLMGNLILTSKEPHFKKYHDYFKTQFFTNPTEKYSCTFSHYFSYVV